MAKTGIIYVMTTAIKGLIKIGAVDNEIGFKETIRSLEENGYANVTNLKLFFAIKVNNSAKKEKLLKSLFRKSIIASTEIYDLNKEDLKELLSSFECKIIYPKENIYEKPSGKIFKRKACTFYEVGLQNGDVIEFTKDPNYKATIVSKNEVEYKGKIFRLSPLTRLICNELGIGNKSNTYAGFDHFSYKGTKLRKLQFRNKYF